VTGDIGEKPRRRIPLTLILWGVAALAVIAGVAWASATGRLSWAMAVDAKEAASGFVAGYPVLAYAGFVGLFVLLALTLFPAQLWVIVFGAMLFGFWPGLILAWTAAVSGAVGVYWAARTVLADRYRQATSKHLSRVEEAFRQDQFAWMLAVRFIPVVPYPVSNVAPAFLGARFLPFLIATLIGVIPYAAGYAFIGAKAGEVLDRDTPPDVASLAADMFPILLVAAALPLLALGVKRLRKKPTR
jgi:uncharacterized membrane protein YdjX (TVP38/TMEM64 family)